MAHELVHRGPDDGGVTVDAASGVGLGFRRLAILGLGPEGHQPLLTPDGRYRLVYNGEVYNYRELRRELEGSGIHFRGSSDSEVVLHALATWGVERAVQRFIGMFAFALWDSRERTLSLGRDRLGIKPLYYGMAGGALVFGSELKALRAHPEFAPELDTDVLAAFFRHNYVPAPHSVYKGVHKLLPGHWAKIVSPSDVRPVSYWDARATALARRGQAADLSVDQAVDQLDQLVRTSVADRMVADVPLGAFLSGGIDSSLVVAAMQAQSSRPVRTFTIGFEEDRFNEAHYAKEVAQHLGTDHTELYLTGAQAREVIPSLPDLWDEPFSDSSEVATHLVSRLAREHVTVCLSGDGGDELFGGYRRYARADRLRAQLSRLPRGGRQLLGGALGNLARLRVGGGKAVRRLRRISEILGARNEEELYKLMVSHWTPSEQIVLGASEPTSLFEDASLRIDFPDFWERMMWLDSVTYLPDDILCKVDRASMGTRLEARVPLLDHRLVEWAWGLARSVRVGAPPGKALMRACLARYCPPRLFERPKRGFSVPISRWIREDLKDWADALLDRRRMESDGILNAPLVQQRWKEHSTGRFDWGYHLWDVLMFQAWKERWHPR